MAFKMKKFSGFKQEDLTELTPLEEGEGEPKMGTAPGAPKLIYETGKKIVQGHTKLHEESEGVRKATKATKPWSMGSMK